MERAIVLYIQLANNMLKLLQYCSTFFAICCHLQWRISYGSCCTFTILSFSLSSDALPIINPRQNKWCRWKHFQAKKRRRRFKYMTPNKWTNKTFAFTLKKKVESNARSNGKHSKWHVLAFFFFKMEFRLQSSSKHSHQMCNLKYSNKSFIRTTFKLWYSNGIAKRSWQINVNERSKWRAQITYAKSQHFLFGVSSNFTLFSQHLFKSFPVFIWLATFQAKRMKQNRESMNAPKNVTLRFKNDRIFSSFEYHLIEAAPWKQNRTVYY